MKNAYSTYKTANVDTADQGKLILIAYDVAIKHCRMALEKFTDTKMIEERTKHLYKVQDAISELMGSLRLDVGEIAQNLYRLYDYMLRRLVHANAKSESECIKEVLGYLLDLRGAWSDAIQAMRQQNTAADGDGQPQSITVTG